MFGVWYFGVPVWHHPFDAKHETRNTKYETPYIDEFDYLRIYHDLILDIQIIGIEDVLIAASALSNKCNLITANTRHFSGIRG